MEEEIFDKRDCSSKEYELGMKCLSDGDTAAAVEHFTAGANDEEPNALCALGICYYEGKGVRQDYARAVRFLERAADQDHAEAKYRLGVIYTEGKGIPKDDGKALEYYRAAASKGYPEAIYAFAMLQYGKNDRD